MAWCHQATTITWANVDKINDISCKISMSITMKSALFFFSYRYCGIPMNGFGCNDDYSITIHIDGFVQERCNSSALAMELRLSCTNPSIWSHTDIISLKTHWNDVYIFRRSSPAFHWLSRRTSWPLNNVLRFMSAQETVLSKTSTRNLIVLRMPCRWVQNPFCLFC